MKNFKKRLNKLDEVQGTKAAVVILKAGETLNEELYAGYSTLIVLPDNGRDNLDQIRNKMGICNNSPSGD